MNTQPFKSQEFRDRIKRQLTGFPSLLQSAEDERRRELNDIVGNVIPDRVEANNDRYEELPSRTRRGHGSPAGKNTKVTERMMREENEQ